MRFTIICCVLLFLVVSVSSPALAQTADCDPAAIIAQANALTSSGDDQKDIAALIELSTAIQNAATSCRQEATTFPAAPAGTGTRKNPVPLGTQYTVSQKFGGVDTEFRVTITSVLRGDEAFKALPDGNSKAEHGFEYVLVNIDLQYVKGDEDKVVEFTAFMFDSVSNNKKLSTPLVFLFEKGFGEDLYPDSEASGLGAYLVEVGDAKPLIVLSSLGFSGSLEEPVYFAAYQ
jgi:hypothetical protein